jgi:hypothetical protein
MLRLVSTATEGSSLDHTYALVIVSCAIAFGIGMMWIGLRG